MTPSYLVFLGSSSMIFVLWCVFDKLFSHHKIHFNLNLYCGACGAFFKVMVWNYWGESVAPLGLLIGILIGSASYNFVFKSRVKSNDT